MKQTSFIQMNSTSSKKTQVKSSQASTESDETSTQTITASNSKSTKVNKKKQRKCSNRNHHDVVVQPPESDDERNGRYNCSFKVFRQLRKMGCGLFVSLCLTSLFGGWYIATNNWSTVCRVAQCIFVENESQSVNSVKPGRTNEINYKYNPLFN